MKSYSVFLSELNEGSSLSALTAALAELLQTVQNTGRSGALSTTLKITPTIKANNGSVDKVTITLEHSLKLPKPEQPSDFFYLTDDGETSRQHPRQHALELRQISDVPALSIRNATAAQ